MASQLQRVTRNSRLRPDQIAMLQARMSTLPTLLRQRERASDLQMQQRQNKKNRQLQKSAMRMQEDARRKEMGVKAAGLGFTLASSPTANRALSKVPFVNKVAKPGSIFGNIKTGDVVGAGLAGYGASKLAKKKGTSALLGSLAGAGTSLASGGNPFTGALTGGLGSLIGRLF